MKKIIIFLVLTLATFAETVKVNMDYVMSKHPKFETIKTELDTEKQRLQGILDAKQNELNLEKSSLEAKGDKVTEDEAESFYKKEQEVQNLYAQAQNSLLTFKNQKMQGLFTDILAILEILQKNKKYSAVVDVQGIFLGTDSVKDVSEEVIQLFKSTEKINLF